MSMPMSFRALALLIVRLGEFDWPSVTRSTIFLEITRRPLEVKNNYLFISTNNIWRQLGIIEYLNVAYEYFTSSSFLYLPPQATPTHHTPTHHTPPHLTTPHWSHYPFLSKFHVFLKSKMVNARRKLSSRPPVSYTDNCSWLSML